jgi:hypothetical protein
MSGHGPHADPHDPFQRRTAIFMAIYTVVIAFNSMLTTQARTRALLLSNEATNKWSYFQSKSTKQVITAATRDVLARLPEMPVVAAGEGEGKPVQRVALSEAIEKLTREGERYEHEKEEIKKEAEEIVEKGQHQQHREHWFEYATVVAELAIVLAGVALLLASKTAFRISALLALTSLGLSGWTFFH